MSVISATRPMLFALTAGTVLASAGCIMIGGNAETVRGSGTLASETREVDDFDSVRLEGSADVEIEIGPAKSVTVRSDDNVLDLVKTGVRGDTLTITTKGRYRTRNAILVLVTAPSLNGVSLSGSGDIRIRGVTGDSFSVNLSGSGDIEAAGRVESLEASLQGSGDIILDALEATRAKVSVAGSGDVDVNVSQALVAEVYGSGDIEYSGNPESVDRSVFGSGEISRR